MGFGLNVEYLIKIWKFSVGKSLLLFQNLVVEPKGYLLMSGAPRVRSMNVADPESRAVFGPAGNKAGPWSARKPTSKSLRKVDKSPEQATLADEEKKTRQMSSNTTSPQLHSSSVPSVLRRHEQLLHSNLSLNASCSSDASTDSFHSRASTGRLTRSYSTGSRRKPYVSRPRSVASDGGLESLPDDSQHKKRCSWVTSNTGLWFSILGFKVKSI